jgi:hypothetical protein
MLEQQVLKRVKDSDFGMNSKSFPAIIEDIVKEKKISYIDATLETCERLLNKQIKEKIEFDALNNNQLKYKKRTLV